MYQYVLVSVLYGTQINTLMCRLWPYKNK